MNVLIKIHFTYRGVSALRRGYFPLKKSIPYTAYLWLQQLIREMPGMKVIKILHDEDDITNDVKNIKGWSNTTFLMLAGINAGLFNQR